jgi:hypothetical protein
MQSHQKKEGTPVKKLLAMLVMIGLIAFTVGCGGSTGTGTGRPKITPPKDDAAKPKDDNAKPKDDAAKPKDDNAKPKDDAAKPKDDAAKPKDDDAKPKDDAAKKDK